MIIDYQNLVKSNLLSLIKNSGSKNIFLYNLQGPLWKFWPLEAL